MLILTLASIAISQTTFEEHRTLSLLRGTWECPTYDEVYRLVFMSDSKLEVNGIQHSYSLQQNNLHVSNDEETEFLAFEIRSSQLLITYPEGNQRKFTKKKFGPGEQQLVGAFYPSDDTSWFASCLQFFDDMKFTLTEPSTGTTKNPSITFSKRNGFFRVEENEIVLAYDDGNIAKALIRFRTSDGMIDGLIFKSRLFDRELLFANEPHKDSIIYPSPGPNPHPPCLSCPAYPPPEPIIIYVPVSTSVVSDPSIENKRRDFGTMRGGSTSDNSISGHREEPGSRRGKP